MACSGLCTSHADPGEYAHPVYCICVNQWPVPSALHWPIRDHAVQHRRLSCCNDVIFIQFSPSNNEAQPLVRPILGSADLQMH